MTLPTPSSPAVATALARWAGARPEAPFLFYRNARGHFRWWSFGYAAAYLERGVDDSPPARIAGLPVDREAHDLLGGFLRAVATAPPLWLPSSSPGARSRDASFAGEREVWISWRPLQSSGELALAQWAVSEGAAILVDPAPALHPELVAWARPTIVSGRAAELAALAAGFEALAPRWLRRRWFRQRQRLAWLAVTGPSTSEERAALEAQWRALSPDLQPQLGPLPPAALV